MNSNVIHSDFSSAAGVSNLYDPADPLRGEIVGCEQPSSSMKSRVKEMTSRIRPVVDRTLTSAKMKSADVTHQAKSFMHGNPAAVAGISTGLGLAVGMLLRGMMRRNRHLGVLVVETRPAL